MKPVTLRPVRSAPSCPTCERLREMLDAGCDLPLAAVEKRAHDATRHPKARGAA